MDDRGRRSSYSEQGANLWICAPSSGGSAGVFTTYNYGRYSDRFGGTSAAAPTVSGVVALVRAANPALTWRDVKLILAASARRNDSSSSGWRTGASRYGASGRYNFNHEYGFGVVDAKAAVDLADGWENVPPFIETDPVVATPGLAIPDRTSSGVATVTSSVTIGTEVEFIEFVEVIADFEAAAFRDLEVELVSPSNTVSTLAVRPVLWTRRGTPTASTPTSGSVRRGIWARTPPVPGRCGSPTIWLGYPATLRSWSLKIYGHRSTPGAPPVPVATAGRRALTVYWSPPSVIGASEVTSYDVRTIQSLATDKADRRWRVEQGVGTPGTLRHTVTGLVDRVEYDVQVRGVNAKGEGAWSAPATATTLPNRAPQPVGSLAGLDLQVGDGAASTSTSRSAFEDPDDGPADLWRGLVGAGGGGGEPSRVRG